MSGDNNQQPLKEATILPRHIAIVMDGNGRWAKKRLLPRPAGHREGAKVARRIIRACIDRGIEVLTLFAFSSENWRRPPSEVSTLMNLFLETLRSEVCRLHENNVRLQFIGDRHAFSDTLQMHMSQAEALSADNTGLTLVIAANYGGRWDIVQATQKLIMDVTEGYLSATDITPEQLSNGLSLHGLPEPDLFIRTGGEQRISNFLLWQMAYTELYFSDQLWPDFKAEDLDQACADFAKRQRRFGQTGEQVERSGGA
jgi:undecaprenyl diphosphate synthase